jgi:hypothetical protein
MIAIAAIAGGLATAAYAAPTLDTSGKCRDNGKFVAASHCKAAAPAKAAKCRDGKGKFVSCSAPGAKPVK